MIVLCFNLSYKPWDQADLHCVFMRPHLQLTHVVEQWLVVKAFWWWVRPETGPRGWSRWLSGDGHVVLFEAYWAFVCVMWVWFCPLMSFSGWNSFSLFAGDTLSLSFEALFQCYQVSELFLFLLSVGINNPSFLLLRTSLLFYYSTATVFLVGSDDFLPFLPDCDLLEQMVCIWLI